METNYIAASLLLLAGIALAVYNNVKEQGKPKPNLPPQPVPAPVNPPKPSAIDWRVSAGQTLFALIDDFERNGLPEGAALLRQAGTKLYEGKKSE